MRVGIDYWPATTHAPGIGRYVRELVRALVPLDDAPALALFDVGPGPRTLPDEALGLASRRSGSASDPDSDLQRVRRALPRRLFGLLAADRFLGGVDLFHRAFHDRPRIARAAEILPVAEPPGAADPRFDAALRRARRVIVFSHALRARLLERHALPAERVRTVPVGCDHWRRDLALRAVPPSPRPRLVVLGARKPARRPLEIADAFERLVAEGLDAELVFAGRAGPDDAALAERGRAAPLEGRLHLRTPRETELPELVAGSSVLVHLNDDEEHTPVTPLEAFSFGLAVVAPPWPAFEEALDDEAVWWPAGAGDGGVASLASTLATALELARDPERRAARIAIADEYTWHAHARATVALWREAADA